MIVQYATLFVSNMAEATAFFRDVVGLPLAFESPGWTEFATEGARVALHHTEVAAQPSAGGTPAGQAQIGFNVPDLDAFHARMAEHDVRCVKPPELLHGAYLAQYGGPDGMIFSVGQVRSQ